MRVNLRQIGNSKDIVIPRRALAQLGLDSATGVDITIEDCALVLRKPTSPPRTGWAEAARDIARACDDELVMGEIGSAVDDEWAW